jgi:hypothetical protein
VIRIRSYPGGFDPGSHRRPPIPDLRFINNLRQALAQHENQHSA